MQAYRDHLRADEDVDLARTKSVERFAISVLARHRIGIHTLHRGLGKEARNRFLDALSAGAGILDARIGAVGTFRRRDRSVAADVADEAIRRAMKCERNRAVRAVANVAALRANERRGKAAPI